jgi:transposase InsO family protein
MNIYPFIAAEQAAAHHVATACALLEVSTSAYYRWSQHIPSARERADHALGDRIERIHRESRGTYGSPRVHRALRREGVRCGRRRVARLMASRALVGRCKRRWQQTTVADPTAHGLAADRLGRAFGPTELTLDRVWVGDITYLRTWEGWCYLATVIDLASRRVVGFAIADHMRTSLACDALRMALAARRPAPGLISSIPTAVYWAPRRSSASCSTATRWCSRSAGRGSAGTTPSPKASSPRSRPSSFTGRRGPHAPPCGTRSSSSSRCSTIAAACTPRSATVHLRSTRQRCSHEQGALRRRPKQSVRQTGSSPYSSSSVTLNCVPSRVGRLATRQTGLGPSSPYWAIPARR